MPQSTNQTENKKREEVEFKIPQGEQDSNVVKCENKSLQSLLMLQNIESDNVEILGSTDNNLFYPLSWNDEELGFSVLETPWDLKHSYSRIFFKPDIGEPTDLFFNSDGSKLFITTNGGKIQHYNLLSTWDISTAVEEDSFDVSDKESSPQDIYFKSDGSRMYVTGDNSGKIHSYKLSEAWDITTASYANSLDVSGEEANPRSIYIKSDGTQIFLIGSSSDKVHSYDLLTPWNIKSASTGDEFDVSGQDGLPKGIYFKSDGKKMFITGASSDKVHSYNLSTEWDITSASSANSHDVGPQEGDPHGLFFSSSGAKMYVIGQNSDSIYLYELSSDWDISSASLPDSYDVTNEESSPNGMFFKPDGKKIYIIGQASDSVHSYNLSTPWEVSTATSDDSFDISAQEGFPQALFFKPDGAQMFIIGTANDTVYSYDLSTLWDISTASLSNNFDVSGKESTPNGLFFKPDGTMMFITGSGSGKVFAYELSTAWDITTASLSNNLDVSGEESQPNDLYIRSDGKKLYVVGNSSDSVHLYDLSIGWDVGTASINDSIDVSELGNSPEDVFFKYDGTKMYVLRGRVYEYLLKRSAWVSIAEPSLTKPYKYLQLHSSEAESVDRIIKGIIGA